MANYQQNRCFEQNPDTLEHEASMGIDRHKLALNIERKNNIVLALENFVL